MKYYAMGYYIHTCQKSVYKGEFFPSEVICPVTHNFVPLNSVKEILDKNKFSRLTDEKKNENIDLSENEKISIFKDVEVKTSGKDVSLYDLMNISNKSSSSTNKIKEFIDNVGKTVKNIIFKGSV